VPKILVTGGAGFIGSEFLRQAVDIGFDVLVIDKLTYAGDLERIKDLKEKIKFYQLDILDKENIYSLFKKERPDFVVHWAAESHVDRSIIDANPFMETNVLGTLNLLDAARLTGIKKFINISTDEVYGELGEDGSFYETSPLNPNSPYSVSKASADMLGRAYFRTYGLPVITVRPSNNYGPWQYPEKLIPVIILKALNNEKVPLYGKGENIREWLYVSDCAKAIFSILEKAVEGDIYNVGSGEEKRNIDVARAILKILNKSEDLIDFVDDRPGHDFRYSLNSDKIHKIGWTTSVTFSKGLEMTVEWYLKNMDWVKNKIKNLGELWDKVYRR
jgi:dTDP-glucose 4,6-dehydratase